MSRRTLSDICENVVLLGTELPMADDGADLQEGWSLVYSACNSGKEGKLYSDAFAKVVDGRLHAIHIVNSSEMAAGGGESWVAFTMGDQRQILDDLAAGELDEDVTLPLCNGIASDEESIQLLLADFQKLGLGQIGPIRTQSTVQQTL